MERPSAWKRYTPTQLAELERFASDYADFISRNKTERECVADVIERARAAGYRSLEECIASGEPLGPGDRIFASMRGKSLILAHLGTADLESGVNILGAHIDSPRLDVKQNPLEEKGELAYLDTHYYGGIKKYQWVTTPLAIHGVVAKKDGSVISIVVGEEPGDPVFVISDLLVHLSSEQMGKEAAKVIEGEMLDVICAHRPLVIEGEDGQKDPVRRRLLELLEERYGMDEEDFLSAELEVVPAGSARDLGFDRSMILGYGQDDRACAYPSVRALLDLAETPRHAALAILVDKEEVGSIGATSMKSRFFENVLAELVALTGHGDSMLALRRCLTNAQMLSGDVAAGFDPSYASAFDPKNAAYLGRGMAMSKYTGARGKGASNDADAEYVARIRSCMDAHDVAWQTAELGRVDQGGGGTIAYILANYGARVVDCGVPVLSMHAPWEVASKADLYETFLGYQAFLTL